MGIQMQYDKSEDIPEITVKELFAEKDGKMVFTGIEGLKTQSDIDKLNEALRKERNDHSTLKESMKKFESVDLEKVKEMENKIISLETMISNGGQSEETVSAIVEKRLAIEIADYTEKLSAYEAENKELKNFKFGQEQESKILESIKDKISKDQENTVKYILKNNSERQADGSYLLKDCKEFGLSSGMTFEQGVQKMSEINPMFAPQNTAGNARGANNTSASSTNPFQKTDGMLQHNTICI